MTVEDLNTTLTWEKVAKTKKESPLDTAPENDDPDANLFKGMWATGSIEGFSQAFNSIQRLVHNYISSEVSLDDYEPANFEYWLNEIEPLPSEVDTLLDFAEKKGCVLGDDGSVIALLMDARAEAVKREESEDLSHAPYEVDHVRGHGRNIADSVGHSNRSPFAKRVL